MNHQFYQYLIEIDAWNGTAIETLKFSGSPSFGAGWLPYLRDPGLLRVDMFKSNKTHGGSSYSYGEVVLNNIADEANGDFVGPLDFLRTYSFDGRAIRMYQGVQGESYGSFTLVYRCTIENISFNWDTIDIALRSRQAELDVMLDGGTFAGNNALPLGVEGVESDLKDKPKPILIGRVFNASPVLCNTSKLIYAISPSTGISYSYMGSDLRVYDNGILLDFGLTYSDQNDMETTAPAPGHYGVWEAGGYIRLGSSPAGNITFDGCSYGRSVTSKASNLIADVLALAGKDSMIDSVSFDSIAASVRYENGVYLNGAVSISNVIDHLCSGGGLYWYFTTDAKMALGQFVDPATLSADYTFTVPNTVITNFKRQKTKDTEGGIPANALTLYYAKNYTVQDKVAGSVPASRLAWLKEEWRQIQEIDTNVTEAHPTSDVLLLETGLTKSNTAEAQRRFALYSVERDLVSFDVDLIVFGNASVLRPGLCFSITLNGRYGFANKKMVLVGYVVNHETEKVSLDLWG